MITKFSWIELQNELYFGISKVGGKLVS
jgi:hypothetical protein